MQKMATIYSPIYTIADTLTDNSFYQQTIQTISWQLLNSQLSGCQDITTKNQIVWQFLAIHDFTENQAIFTTFTHICQHKLIPPTS